MGTLDRYFTGGGTSGLRQVDGGSGTVNLSATGPRLTITPAAGEIVVFGGSITSQDNSIVQLKFGGRVTFSGKLYRFFTTGFKAIGGKGEEFILDCSFADNKTLYYAYQILEEDN